MKTRCSICRNGLQCEVCAAYDKGLAQGKHEASSEFLRGFSIGDAEAQVYLRLLDQAGLGPRARQVVKEMREMLLLPDRPRLP